jgi:hypothetical protein
MKERRFTSQPPTQEQHREGHWGYEELKQHIIDAYAEGRAISFEQLPTSIDISRMATKTMECVRRMNEDPEHREHGALIVYDPRSKRLAMHRDDQIIVGDETSILPTGGVIIDPSTGEASQIAGFIHTHPKPTGFSGNDIASLLTDAKLVPEHKQSYGQLFLLGDTTGAITALVASAETERNIDPADIRQRFSDLFFANINAQIQQMQAERNRGSHNLQQRFSDLFFPGKKPQMKRPTEVSMPAAEQDTIAQLAEEYKLGYYRGDSSGILRRFRVKKTGQE